MPNIVTNEDLVNNYDTNSQVVSTRILANEAPDDDEHAAQCLAIEMLRSLLASGMTPEQYNDMPEMAYQAMVLEAYNRSKLNVNAPAHILTEGQISAAANIGGNYFEHGYHDLMSGPAGDDAISFTRVGGL